DWASTTTSTRIPAEADRRLESIRPHRSGLCLYSFSERLGRSSNIRSDFGDHQRKLRSVGYHQNSRTSRANKMGARLSVQYVQRPLPRIGRRRNKQRALPGRLRYGCNGTNNELYPYTGKSARSKFILLGCISKYLHS